MQPNHGRPQKNLSKFEKSSTYQEPQQDIHQAMSLKYLFRMSLFNVYYILEKEFDPCSLSFCCLLSPRFSVGKICLVFAFDEYFIVFQMCEGVNATPVPQLTSIPPPKSWGPGGPMDEPWRLLVNAAEIYPKNPSRSSKSGSLITDITLIHLTAKK